MEEQHERMGSGFGYHPQFYEPRYDPRTQRPAGALLDPFAVGRQPGPRGSGGERVPPPPPPAAPPPNTEPRSLMDLLEATRNLANPGAGPAGARSGYGPIPSIGGPAAADPGSWSGTGPRRDSVYPGRSIRGDPRLMAAQYGLGMAGGGGGSGSGGPRMVDIEGRWL